MSRASATTASILGVASAAIVALRLVVDTTLLVTINSRFGPLGNFVDQDLVFGAWSKLLFISPLAFIAWLFTQHLALRDVDAHPRERSHSAFWCWMVPGFNAVQPANLIADIWRTTVPSVPVPRQALHAWWALVLLRVLLLWPAMWSDTMRAVFAATHVVCGAAIIYVIARTMRGAWRIERAMDGGARPRTF